ncbi:ABC transporter permease [Brevibacterium luteolum]|uniref:ABC transporter permease n=1 Tax=Brevibacterium luteolum TaxID=199591 RepID=UPI003B67041F
MQGLFTIFAVVTITFIVGRLAGSPAAQLLPEAATQAEIDALNAELGFDKPVTEQYLTYLQGLLVGNFQDSFRIQGTSSMKLVLERLPSSLLLGAVGLAIGLLLAVTAVFIIQYANSRRLRLGLLALGSLRSSIPDFFFGLILVVIFAVQLQMLPSLGDGTIWHLIMPALTIATAQFVVYMRLFDSSMTQAGAEDFVRTAYAKGEKPSFVMFREMTPNALLPVLTLAGMNLGTFLGGLVIIENVFAWPGLGQLIINGVYTRDFPVVQSGLIIVAVLFVLANLAVDLLQAAIDPRVKLS